MDDEIDNAVAKATVDRYEDRIVAFVDVLGFGALVEASGKGRRAGKRRIKQITEAVLYSIEELKSLAESYDRPPDIAFTHFSDSFVISCPIKNTKRVTYLFTHALITVIDEFLRSDLFLRGGVARGQLVHNDKLLFGPAMNRAYELESKIAKVPRIILDANLPSLDTIGMLDMYVARDNDGFFYIDYFNPQKAWWNVPGWKLGLQKMIESMPDTPKLRDKRRWLISKFNRSLRGYSYEKFRSDFRDYCDDLDANNAVVANGLKILSAARGLHRIET
jgi:hypothetical protein